MGALTGQVYQISGALSVGRAEFAKLLERHGAKVAKSMNKSVTVLVMAETGTGSAKEVKAAASGVDVVSEEWVRQQTGEEAGENAKKKAAPAKKKAKAKAKAAPAKAKAKAKAAPAPAKTKAKAASSQTLTGQVYQISGTLSVGRAEFAKLLERHGATVAKSMNKSVTVLVMAHTGTGTAKEAKAAASGIAVVSEDWVRQQTGEMAVKKEAPATPAKAGAASASASASAPSVSPAKKGKGKGKAAAKSKGKGTKRKLDDDGDDDDEEEDDMEVDEDDDDDDDDFVHVVDSQCFGFSEARVWKAYDAVLNQSNLSHGANNNKFYLAQLLESNGEFQLWTRWGRVGESGQSQLIPASSEEEGIAAFKKKFKDKTRNNWEERGDFVAKNGKYTLLTMSLKRKDAGAAKKKGAAKKEKAKPGFLATLFGFDGCEGGEGGEEAAESAPAKKKAKTGKHTGRAGAGAKKRQPSTLHPKVQGLLQYIYSEAKSCMTSSVKVEITAHGLQLPLGALGLEQLDKGDEILQRLLALVTGSGSANDIRSVSSEFYSNIPVICGRSQPPPLNSLERLKEKADLLELMRDMVNVSAKSQEDGDDDDDDDDEPESVLFSNDVDQQYRSLGCELVYVEPSSAEHKAMVAEIKASQLRSHGRENAVVANLFRFVRDEEVQRYKGAAIGNEQTVYHGSRIANWVGLLGRGLLMPKIVVSQGVHRTDPGWLGDGLYFGNADTAAGYAGAGKKGTAFFLANSVALGKVKEYKHITYGLQKPPAGFHSCQGVKGSEFYDDEFVVYGKEQVKSTYLVEIKQI